MAVGVGSRLGPDCDDIQMTNEHLSDTLDAAVTSLGYRWPRRRVVPQGYQSVQRVPASSLDWETVRDWVLFRSAPSARSFSITDPIELALLSSLDQWLALNCLV